MSSFSENSPVHQSGSKIQVLLTGRKISICFLLLNQTTQYMQHGDDSLPRKEKQYGQESSRTCTQHHMLEQIKTHLLGTGDMAQWFRVISALAGDGGSASSTQMLAYIHLLQEMPFSELHAHPTHTWCINIYSDPEHKINLEKIKPLPHLHIKKKISTTSLSFLQPNFQ